MPLNPNAAAFALDPAAPAFVLPSADTGLAVPDAAGPAAAAPKGAWGKGPPAAAVLRMQQEKGAKEGSPERAPDDGLSSATNGTVANSRCVSQDAPQPMRPVRKELSALSEADTNVQGASSSEEGTGSASSEAALAWMNAQPAAVATLGAAESTGGPSAAMGSGSCTSTELEMSFDDVVDEPSRSRCRSPSLSPRRRFYGDDDGEVPVLLWAPSPYTNSPLYQGFGFGDLAVDPDELRSPHGLLELAAAGAAREQWFSGGSAHSSDWSESNGTPASQGGEGAWGEDVELRGNSKTRASQACVRKSGVHSSGPAPAHEQFQEFNCKVTVDDFEILHMIGEGGFGKVYQVRQRSRSRQDPSSGTGRILAMKCMRKEAVLQDNLKGTKNERSILSRLRHPYIVTMHFAFQCKGRLYLIMDYFPGGQFLDMLHKNSPFATEAVQIYAGEIFLALKELHANGIVHRDLKPENILVDIKGHLVVTDFGCSKVHDDLEQPIRSNSWAGTELYMAPEQLCGKEYGQEVDWWALGVLVWEMVTGDHPFYHKNRKTIHNNILKKKLNLPSYHPRATHTFVKGLLTRDAGKRLGSASGAIEIETHPFFEGLDFAALLRKEIEAPMKSHALTDSELDVSAHSKRYTSAAACLSPLLSPQLSSSQHEAFVGFSFYGDSFSKPDLSSTPFRTSADHLWQDEALEPLTLTSPALAAVCGSDKDEEPAQLELPPTQAQMVRVVPPPSLVPVREVSGMDLSEMAKAAEVEAFAAAVRDSTQHPSQPAGLLPGRNCEEGDGGGQEWSTSSPAKTGLGVQTDLRESVQLTGGLLPSDGNAVVSDEAATNTTPQSTSDVEVHVVVRPACSPPSSPSLGVARVAAVH